MTRFVQMLLLFLFMAVSSLLNTALSQETTVLLSSDAPKRVLVPKSDIGLTWRTKIGFDDSSWKLCTGAPGAIGYEAGDGYQNLITLNVQSDMYQGGTDPNNSCFVRWRFTLTAQQLAAINTLMLNVLYDDGFAAYLNGIKVAEANLPTALLWNSAATGNHEADNAESFIITQLKDLLKDGENLLTIHALNNDISSSDFIINAELISRENPFQNFTASNLPLIYIDTGGKWIPDEPKITAHMGIIYHGTGSEHILNESYNNYNGKIGIETRGSSSQSWPKKQYAVETWTTAGGDTSVSLMGLPEENDWVLNAPFIDRSFLRNVLAYDLFRRMGRYSSRTRYCELFLNGEYQGIYILMEKIKRDKNRVDISRLDSADVEGEALTGGYIFKIDKEDGSNRDGFNSKYRPINGAQRRVYFQYHYPSQEDLMPQQKAYLQKYVGDFEDMMAGNQYDDPQTGYPHWINIDSFVDFFLISEISKNVDCYRLSTFMYKDRDGKDSKLYMGPVWDYNLAFGLANYYDGTDMDDWMLEELLNNTGEDFPVPFWWDTLFNDPAFNHRIKQRWFELRNDVFNISRIESFIDSVADTLDQAQARNFTIWSAPGQNGEGFWPMPNVFYTFNDYQDEIDYLKYWIRERIYWIDENVKLLSGANHEETELPSDFRLYPPFPNPFNPSTQLTFELPTVSHVSIQVYNTGGQLIRTVMDEQRDGGRVTAVWDGLADNGSAAASGVYFIRFSAAQVEGLQQQSQKVVLVR